MKPKPQPIFDIFALFLIVAVLIAAYGILKDLP